MNVLEVFKIIILGPINDMKTTPGTSVSVLIIWCVIMYASFITLPNLAKASDVAAQQESSRKLTEAAAQVQASVSSLDRRLRYEAMHRDFEQADAELSAVDREIVRLARLNQEPTDFLLDRQQQLQSRKNDIARRLNALVQQFPELVSQ